MTISPGQRRRIVFVSIVGLVALGSYAYSWANNPSVTSGSAAPALAASSANNRANQALDTTYFSTVLPDDVLVRTKNEVAHGNILLQLLATNRTGQVDDQLGLTIGSLNGQPLSELSSVRLRLGDTKNYRQIAPDQTTAQAISFERTGETYEKAVFWPGGNGLYAAVVVSGTMDRSSYLNYLMSTILVGWQWH